MGGHMGVPNTGVPFLGDMWGSGTWGSHPAAPRQVLEKLRPIEHRLKYQLEKLLQAAMTGGRGECRDTPVPAPFAPADDWQLSVILLSPLR